MQKPVLRSARRHAMAALSTVAVLAFAAPTALAQSPAAWPSKPIRLIVNFPPGSSPDVVGRAIAVPLYEALGQPVVVENRVGANGNIGADAVAKAPPDGYTVLMSAGSTVAINPYIYDKLSFAPSKDLVPVAGASRMVLFLVVRPEIPVKNVAEFIAYAKANPGKLSYGSAGSGSGPHLAAEMMNSQAGISTVHVPYKGAAPALQDLLGGQIDYYFDPGIALNQVRAGKLRMIAVAGMKRSALFPDVPTLDEAGLKGLDAGTTHGFYVPVCTPPEIVSRLNREIDKALATPAVHAVIDNLGAVPTPITPAEFRTVLGDDSKRYAAIIKARHIKAD
ncbi:Bug family tripartite tricarboxylate transporter substrate binding protein [Variovorax sp. GT1P44]|uniref:Bug family tripartite tricarboxylate transporter substrate binding protein n=1 Tax=Variovorax sp. GT1P44 TaxID=3443742 RepID=UPI003F4728B9